MLRGGITGWEQDGGDLGEGDLGEIDSLDPATVADLNSGARVTFATHGTPFAAALEQGALSATQFHPEKSGDAGAALLTNWLDTL